MADAVTPPTATDLAALVSDGTRSAVSVVRDALRHAQARHDLRAFTELWPETALEAARRVDARVSSGAVLPLAGVPLGLKAPGSLQTLPARRLVAAGAVPIGVTSAPTRATAWQTWGHTDRGPTVNPWRADRTPGGSSAGSAAAVSAGIVPIATGTDGAGSIRIPAAWCGVIGLKPSAGLIPTTDPTGLSVGGVIARTVRDAAVYLDVVAGTKLRESAQPTEPTRLTAAWSQTLGFADVDPEVAAVAASAMDAMTAAELVVPQQVPVALSDPQNAWLALRSLHAAADSRVTSGPNSDLNPDLNQVELDRLFARVDVLITPTTPNRPHGHDGPGRTMSTALTWAFNLSGHPAISVPAGFTSDGCPVGVQLVGRHGDEATLIRLAAAWERLGRVC